jgi:hypothetical protein
VYRCQIVRRGQLLLDLSVQAPVVSIAKSRWVSLRSVASSFKTSKASTSWKAVVKGAKVRLRSHAALPSLRCIGVMSATARHHVLCLCLCVLCSCLYASLRSCLCLRRCAGCRGAAAAAVAAARRRRLVRRDEPVALRPRHRLHQGLRAVGIHAVCIAVPRTCAVAPAAHGPCVTVVYRRVLSERSSVAEVRYDGLCQLRNVLTASESPAAKAKVLSGFLTALHKMADR